jgi:hypothetical protein
MGFFSMGRQGRILTLLVIDSVFFFVELFGGASSLLARVSAAAIARTPPSEPRDACSPMTPPRLTRSLLPAHRTRAGYAVGSIALIAGTSTLP